jgi:DMSO/TMAO reductase YedYZ molybdopterin-dependent catalytic subunit
MLVAPDTRLDPDGWRDDRGLDELGRDRPGLFVGAVTGFLAAAVAIGVATLAAAFVRPQASPIIAVGGAFIDRTPPALKNFAVQRFGENDKTMLLLGMYVTIAFLAMAIGVLSRRAVALGVAGIAAFGLFGAFVAITRPESRVTDVVPSVIGGIAGVAALIWLAHASVPALLPRRARGPGRRGSVPATAGIDRRKFLTVSSTAAATAVAAGVAGQVLSNDRFSVNTSAVKLAPPATKPKPLARGASLNIGGISPFYTPNTEFYRVDTSLVIPQVEPSAWQLRIHGMVDNPMTITFDELMKQPMIEHDCTLTCVSESVGGNYIGNARWEGTLLADLLRKAGIHPGADQIVMRDVNGMNIGVATDPVMDGRASLLAVGMNGQPLPQAHGFPVRVVVPGLYGYVSACKWVVDMELTTFGAFDAYWVQRGWSQRAPIKTESRIDVPKAGSSLAAGKVVIAGVAWAQHRGIEAVEVSVDSTWYEAKLATQDTIDSWRQWYYVWDATPGQHTLKVRATDKTGHLQTAVMHGPEPNGATGYHTIGVSVT